jgi:pullulanase/glycogen debranching enzyme
MIATLLLSQGVPMILHGDEVGRTQNDDNNTHGQDSVMRLRAEQPVFRRRRFFTGQAERGGLPDIAWLSSDGTPMGEDDWFHPTVQPLGVLLNGQGITEPGTRGQQITDDSFLILFNPPRGRGADHTAGRRIRRVVAGRAQHRRRRCRGRTGGRFAARDRRALACLADVCLKAGDPRDSSWPSLGGATRDAGRVSRVG